MQTERSIIKGGLAGSIQAPNLSSKAAFVFDLTSSRVVLEKNARHPLPIASLTKLMTAMVVIDANQDQRERIVITREDIDRIRFSRSRLPVGVALTRAEMLRIALMSSENRAASALGRHYPGGTHALVEAMNAKAEALGMRTAHFTEPTGLSSENIASPRDLAKLVDAAHKYPLIRKYSTTREYAVKVGKRVLRYVNSNRLIRRRDWQIDLQKTGYITEAGRTLVMRASIAHRPMTIVLLNSDGHLTLVASPESPGFFQ